MLAAKNNIQTPIPLLLLHNRVQLKDVFKTTLLTCFMNSFFALSFHITVQSCVTVKYTWRRTSLSHAFILKRVRAKSLLRFGCVSKSFCSLISDSLFIKAHQKSCVAQILVGCLAWTPRDVIYNLGQREEHQDLARPFQYLDQPCFREFNYINGLVCLWNNVGEVAICNPFKKQHVFLPYQQPTGELYGLMTCCSLC